MKADFDRLFREYYRPLTVFAMQYLGCQQAAEDVVQDTFLYLYKNADKLDINRHNLYRLVRFRALNAKEYSRLRAERDTEIQQQMNSNPEDPLELIARIELEDKYLKALKSVQRKRRRVFEMSRVGGMSNQEIAEELNISKRTVESHISLVLKVLKKKLSKYLILLIAICFMLQNFLRVCVEVAANNMEYYIR